MDTFELSIAQSAQNYNIPSQVIYICASFIGNQKLEFVDIICPEQDAPKYELSLLTENANGICVFGQLIERLEIYISSANIGETYTVSFNIISAIQRPYCTNTFTSI